MAPPTHTKPGLPTTAALGEEVKRARATIGEFAEALNFRARSSLSREVCQILIAEMSGTYLYLE